MSGFETMRFFYGAMIGVPVLLWLVAVISLVYAFFPVQLFPIILDVFAFLLGVASLVYGILGFWEVFMHG